MSQETITQLREKSHKALVSARVLFELQDFDGTCNRAYYAMYDMALACLLSLEDDSIRPGKTHSGTISAFNQYFIKTGLLSADLGRAFKQVETVRYTADYTTEEIPSENAQKVIEQAEFFVEALNNYLSER